MVDAATRQAFLDIASHEYAIPETVNPTAFVLNALPLLGETDGEFRERMVYGTLHRWIVSEAIDTPGLRAIHLALLSDQALFSGIGENGSDTIFLRTFSVLLLVPTIYRHRKQSYLSSEEIVMTCRELARYLREEKDLRGYVSQEKWWAHGIAHAADAVGQLVQCEDLPHEEIAPLLEAVAIAMTPGTAVYAHEEDARMTTAILKLFRRDEVPLEMIEKWLTLVVPEARFNGQLPDVHIQYVNARNFLRCLLHQARASALTDEQVALIEAAHDALPAR